MSLWDSYESIPGFSSFRGGAAKRKSKAKSKSKGKSMSKKGRIPKGVSNWLNFVKKVRSEAKRRGTSLNLSEISDFYRDKNCGKPRRKYTKGLKKLCRPGTMKFNRSCLGYTKRASKMKSKSAKASLIKRCKGYSSRKKRKGKGLFGGMCEECEGTGEGVFGGCACCGGTGMMDSEMDDVGDMDDLYMESNVMGGATRKNIRPGKRCISSLATYKRINDLQKIIDKMSRDGTKEAYPRKFNRYVGALREMKSLYLRQNNIGNSFLSSNTKPNYSQIVTSERKYGPYMVPPPSYYK